MEKKHIDVFVFLILKYKLHKKILKKINGELKEIFNNIQNLMKTIHSHYKNDIVDQQNYNSNINKLEDILNKFKALPNPIKISDLKNIKYKEIREIINHLKTETKNLCCLTGAYTIKDTINILINKNINSDDKLTLFLNNVFRPTSCIIYDKNKKSLEKSLVPYEGEVNNESELTHEDIHKITSIKFRSLDKKSMSIIEHINGIKIYLPLRYGFFKKWIQSPTSDQ